MGGCISGRAARLLKVFHVHDGLGIEQLQRAGIAVAVISGRRSADGDARCRELGVRQSSRGRPRQAPGVQAAAAAPRHLNAPRVRLRRR